MLNQIETSDEASARVAKPGYGDVRHKASRRPRDLNLNGHRLASHWPYGPHGFKSHPWRQATGSNLIRPAVDCDELGSGSGHYSLFGCIVLFVMTGRSKDQALSQ